MKADEVLVIKLLYTIDRDIIHDILIYSYPHERSLFW